MMLNIFIKNRYHRYYVLSFFLNRNFCFITVTNIKCKYLCFVHITSQCVPWQFGFVVDVCPSLRRLFDLSKCRRKLGAVTVFVCSRKQVKQQQLGKQKAAVFSQMSSMRAFQSWRVVMHLTRRRCKFWPELFRKLVFFCPMLRELRCGRDEYVRFAPAVFVKNIDYKVFLCS